MICRKSRVNVLTKFSTKVSSSPIDIVDLENRLYDKHMLVIKVQENYADLIEDVLDELSDIFNFNQPRDYLGGSEELFEERERLHEAILSAKAQILMEQEKAERAYTSEIQETNEDEPNVLQILQIQQQQEQILELETQIAEYASIIDKTKKSLSDQSEAIHQKQLRICEIEMDNANLAKVNIFTTAGFALSISYIILPKLLSIFV